MRKQKASAKKKQGSYWFVSYSFSKDYSSGFANGIVRIEFNYFNIPTVREIILKKKCL